MTLPIKTLAMIKPDAVAAGNAGSIMQAVEAAGFTIVQKKELTLTADMASAFYGEHKGKPFYETLVGFMTSGPIYALALSKEDAILDWRKLMGPTNSEIARESEPKSLRALFGTDNTMNATHGSDSPASASRELKFFFPNITLDALPDAAQARAYIAETLQPTLVKGLTALCKEKPSAGKMEAVTWLANWLLDNNPNKPAQFTEAALPLAPDDPDEFVTVAGAVDEETAIDAMEEEMAAIKMQAHFRGFQARKNMAGTTGAATASMVVIESHTDTAEEEAAATKMQAHFKGHMARKSTKKMKAEEDAAATKLQSSFRGHQTRKDMASKKAAAAAPAE